MSVKIIAEAGVNHNGSLELAKKMALCAKEAGADIVKYQTAVPELVVSVFARRPSTRSGRRALRRASWRWCAAFTSASRSTAS